MTVKILLVTHENIGAALLKATAKTYGKLPIPTKVVAVNYSSDPETLLPRLKVTATNLRPDEGILILTDMFGATPCNLALTLSQYNIHVISGLNLPMLIKTMNYPELTLDELAEKAISGGRDGVVDCSCESEKIG
jgi:mannose PTS system EIIA component